MHFALIHLPDDARSKQGPAASLYEQLPRPWSEARNDCIGQVHDSDTQKHCNRLMNVIPWHCQRAATRPGGPCGGSPSQNGSTSWHTSSVQVSSSPRQSSSLAHGSKHRCSVPMRWQESEVSHA